MRKKKTFKENERVLEGTDALLYMRNGVWQWRVYLKEEGKYLRRSLGTGSIALAEERAYTQWREVERDRAVGKRQYGMTIDEGVDEYLESRKTEVTGIVGDGITKERYTVIAGQLKNFRAYMAEHKEDATLYELDRRDCWNYFRWRRETAKTPPAKTTLMNEKAMINACIKYLYARRHISIPEMDFPKISDVGRKEVEIRTYKGSEYTALHRAARSYIAGKGEIIDEKERTLRTIVYNWILIAANTGLRVGEQKQLRWENVTTYKRDGEILADIYVDPKTTKVRKHRDVIAYGGEYFNRLREITGGNGYVFSEDEGETHISMRRFRRVWHEVMERANIDAERKEHLEPYGLRHYFLTARHDAGVPLAMLAQQCGTSVREITNTYQHWFKEDQEPMAVLGRRRKEE